MSTALRYATEYVAGDILSPSQATKLLNCAFQWHCRYELRLPDPKTGALVMGSSIHDALGENFLQKIDTHRDLDAAGVRAIYRQAWDAYAPDAEFRDDEDPGQLKDQGEILALQYLDEAAPQIEPAAVELPVQGVIGGVHVRGFIDLLDVNGTIIDIKSKASKPSGVDFAHRLQVSTYAALAPAASGAGRVDTLVKTKRPQLVQESFTVTGEDVRMAETIYAGVQQTIRNGGPRLPNRGSKLCSRKYCGYWRTCQATWGGKVGE